MKTKIMAIGLAVLFAISVLAIGTSVADAKSIDNKTYASITELRIDGNVELADNATSGTGVWNDPYILNFTIYADTTNYGLYIGNTTSYFILRNTTVNGTDTAPSHPYFSGAGIHLYNVDNANISNCTVFDCITYGIYLSNDSYNITLYDNTLWNCTLRGIAITDTDDGTFIANTIYGNSTMIFGMSFDDLSDGHIVTSNTIHDVFLVGIGFNDSWTINMDDNEIYGISFAPSFGIIAYKSMYIYTDGNVIRNFSYGGLCVFTNVTEFTNDFIYDCNEGWNISYSNFNNFTREDFTNITTNCIATNHCNVIDMVETTVNDSGTGILMLNTENVIIESPGIGNCVNGTTLIGTNGLDLLNGSYSGNYYSMYISSCIDVEINNCDFSDDTWDSIYIELSDEIESYDCTFTDCGACYDVTQVDEIIIYDPIAVNCTALVFSADDSYVDMYNPTITSCMYAVWSTDSFIGMYYGNITDTLVAMYLSNTSSLIGLVNITDCAMAGIQVQDSIGGVILNCSFSNNVGESIYLTNVTNYTIIGNYFWTATHGDVFDDGAVGDNVWSNVTYGGNWYCNYTGYDSDEDGYGDQPYAIKGGSNTDDYPLGKLNDVPISAISDTILALIPIMITIMVIGMILGFVKKMFADLGKKR